jgi:ribosomal protein S1
VLHYIFALLSYFSFYKSVDCKVTEKTKSGLDIVIGQTGVTGFVPRIHLSDSLATCDLQWEAIKPGDVLTNCVYLNHSSVLVSFMRICVCVK